MAWDENATLKLARRVVDEANKLSIPTALIGAMALAAHGYSRATHDLDLGVCTACHPTLSRLNRHLQDLGLKSTLREPDDEDPLDGLLVVEDGDAVVEVVNIRNVKLGRAAIDRAEVLDGQFRCVRVPELIALKLYAGGRASMADVQSLLDVNPECDRSEIERVCVDLGFQEEWAQILAARG